MLVLPGHNRYRDLTYRAHFGQNGVAELPAQMEPSAGGTAEDPVFRFIGGDADATDWTTWDYPGTPVACARQAVGVQPTYNWGSPLLGADDDSVLFNASDYYKAPNTSFGQVTTEDFIIECIFRAELSGTSTIAATKTSSAAGNIGWQFYAHNDSRLYLKIEDSGGADTAWSDAVLGADKWYHALVFADRSGSAGFYINGVAAGTGVISVSPGDLSAAVAMTLGAAANGGQQYASNIAYLALWEKAAWLTSHLNPDTAAERFGLLAGYWPQVANGTSAPNTATRAYAAYTEKIESGKTRLYQVGSEWLRIAQRIDANSETVSGYLPEPEALNDLGHSNTWTSWAKEDAGDVVTDAAANGPDNTDSMATLVCDNTNGNHGISLATVGNLSADLHCFSVGVGAGNANWVCIEDTTIANGKCWFRLSTGAVGSKQGGVDESGFVNGTWLGPTSVTVRMPYIRFTGTVAPHTVRIRPVDGDGVDTFSGGDGAAVTLHLWEGQVEQGDYPTSRIHTSGGATATRLKDQLQAKGDDGNLGGVGSEERGTVECDLLVADCDVATQRDVLIFSDGGAAADSITWLVHTTGDVMRIDTRATGLNDGDADGSTDVGDGVRHRYRSTWTTDDLRSFVDGGLEAQDTTCGIPDDLDRIDIAQSRGGSVQLNGLISDLKIWSRNKGR